MEYFPPAPAYPVKTGPRRPRSATALLVGGAQLRLVAQIEAGMGEDPGPGGWSGGFANQAHWDPTRPREWRCWAQSGPTWSAHCGAEVAAIDSLGLCQRHRRALLEGEMSHSVEEAELPALPPAAAPEPALRAG